MMFFRKYILLVKYNNQNNSSRFSIEYFSLFFNLVFEENLTLLLFDIFVLEFLLIGLNERILLVDLSSFLSNGVGP